MTSVDKQDMVIRRLAIIGEAVKNLPSGLRQRYPQVAWREIAGMRDVLVHEYFDVDLELTWKVIQEDVPFASTVPRPTADLRPGERPMGSPHTEDRYTQYLTSQ